MVSRTCREEASSVALMVAVSSASLLVSVAVGSSGSLVVSSASVTVAGGA